MAEKISTMILTVDLDCCCCYKKIRKTLCKLQGPEKIKSIAYDEKKKTVTISGPFDPQKLFQKLCCKACKCILEIEIVKPKPPKPTPTPPPPPPPPTPPPVYVHICLAGKVCRCNSDSSCKPCKDAGGRDEPCSCGCGGKYRPCHCGCGKGYVKIIVDLPACSKPCSPPRKPCSPAKQPSCQAGNVCRCNWDSSCKSCQDGGRRERTCSCGCGRDYSSGCGKGYVPTCGVDVVYKEELTACIIM